MSNSTDPRQRLQVDERKAQLLALGQHIFAERAYEDVSIGDIAKEAGISKGLLYHYFPSKRDFYVESVREAARVLLEATMPTDAGAAPLTRLHDAIDAYLDYVDKRSPAFVSLMRSGIGTDTEVAAILEDTRQEILSRLIEPLEPYQVTPTLRTALRGWIGAVEAMSLDWLDHKDIDRTALTHLCAATLMGAFRAVLGAAWSPE
jgi:AcrR family transcriptional regulator